MDVRYGDDDLERLIFDPRFSARLPSEVVTKFRKVVAFLRRAKDEREIRAWHGLAFKKLKEDLAGRYAMRLNRQWRLLADLEGGTTIILQKIDNHYSD